MTRRNRSRLQIDFPTVLSNYASLSTAERSISRAVARTAHEACGYFVAMYDETEVGILTYQQSQVRQPRQGLSQHLSASPMKTLVEGPNVAIWLDRLRPEAARGQGGRYMRLLIERAVADGRTSGTLWTVTRAGNFRSQQLMASLSRPSFSLQASARRWRIGDAVTVPRLLFVANQSQAQLRGSANHA